MLKDKERTTLTTVSQLEPLANVPSFPGMRMKCNTMMQIMLF